MKTMKHAFLIIAFAAVSHTSASARVGETEKEIVTRYGDGARSDLQRQPGAETFKYFKNNFQIEVVIHDGKSIWEIFQKQDGDKYISDGDIKNILEGYKAPGQNWLFERDKKLWKRSGKPKYVAYRWPGWEEYLCVKDVAACEALDKQRPGSKGL